MLLGKYLWKVLRKFLRKKIAWTLAHGDGADERVATRLRHGHAAGPADASGSAHDPVDGDLATAHCGFACKNCQRTPGKPFPGAEGKARRRERGAHRIRSGQYAAKAR